MIKKKDGQATETRTEMRGGTGTVTIKHYFKKDEIQARCRLCAEMVVPPGSSVGQHEHSNEDEVYIIQEGKGIIIDNGVETEVEAGDAILTGMGSAHAIKNIGDTDLRVTAIIMQYS